MGEEYLWGFANPVPLRAMFTDGTSQPVVGFSAVRSQLDSNKANSPLVTIMVGIAIFNNGLIFCESCEDFLGYAEPPYRIVDEEGKPRIIDEGNDLLKAWQQGQQGTATNSNNLTGFSAPTVTGTMELIRTIGDVSQADEDVDEHNSRYGENNQSA